MKKRKLGILSMILLLCIALSLGTAAVAFADTFEPLGTYDDAVIGESNSHEAEFNIADYSKKRTDFGIRVPGSDALNGDPMDGYNPGSNGGNIGNGVTVAENTAKLRMVYGGGGARFRYGYAVNLADTVIRLNICDLQDLNGHINLTISKNPNAVSHAALQYDGVTVIIYKDSPNKFQATILSAKNRNAVKNVEGQDIAPFTFNVDESDLSTLAFEVATSYDADSVDIKVSNKTQSTTFSLPIDLKEQLATDQAQTYIGLNCFSNGEANDNINAFMTYTIQINDSYRTAYENEVLNPFKAKLAEFTAEKINAATISTIEDVNAWIAKRDAVTNEGIASLRYSDRYLLQPNTVVNEANVALKAKAGAAVKTYLDGEVATFKTTFATAQSDTEYKTITTRAAQSALQAAYDKLNNEVNVKYAALNSADETELAAYRSALDAAAKALARLDVHLDIYDVEHMDMSDADAIVAAKAAYAAINTDDFKATINDLATTDAVKNDLKARLAAIDTAIQDAEASLNAEDVVDKQIKNYEDAPITTIAEMRAALEVRKLINDYSTLDGKEAFAARVAAKDKAIEDAAYAIIKVSVDEVTAKSAGEIDTYQKMNALSGAIGAVTDTDLLSTAKQGEVADILDAASDKVTAFKDTMKNKKLALGSFNGTDSVKADLQFTDKGVKFTFTGEQDNLIFLEKQDITKGVSVVFSVEQWAYLNNDGQGYNGNNSYLFFTPTAEYNGKQVNRNVPGALTIMYWNVVSSSFAKAYYMNDEQLTQDDMDTFGENDGSYVKVTLTLNSAKSRYEIETSQYNANDELLSSVFSYVNFQGTLDENTYKDGVYVSLSGHMDHKGDLANIWYLHSVGETSFVKEEGGVTPPPGPDDNDDKDTGRGCSCGGSMGFAAGSLGLLGLVCLAMIPMLVRKRR